MWALASYTPLQCCGRKKYAGRCLKKPTHTSRTEPECQPCVSRLVHQIPSVSITAWGVLAHIAMDRNQAHCTCHHRVLRMGQGAPGDHPKSPLPTLLLPRAHTKSPLPTLLLPCFAKFSWVLLQPWKKSWLENLASAMQIK